LIWFGKKKAFRGWDLVSAFKKGIGPQVGEKKGKKGLLVHPGLETGANARNNRFCAFYISELEKGKES